MKLPLIPILLLASFAGAQCPANVGTPGTTCQGPLSVTAPSGNTVQANIVLVDVGMAPATPAVKQYILSIQNGTLVESDNGGAYHSLVGPKGDTGLAGLNGMAATVSVGTVTTGAPGSQVKVTNSGSTSSAVFNFSIPQGAQGSTGVVVGQTISGMLNCQGQKGKSIPSGFTTPCTFKVSGIK